MLASSGEVRGNASHDKVEGRWSRPKTDLVQAAPDAWQKIEDLAQRVLRLTISRRDPEQFFVERSDIAGEMRRLARAVR